MEAWSTNPGEDGPEYDQMQEFADQQASRLLELSDFGKNATEIVIEEETLEGAGVSLAEAKNLALFIRLLKEKFEEHVELFNNIIDENSGVTHPRIPNYQITMTIKTEEESLALMVKFSPRPPYKQPANLMYGEPPASSAASIAELIKDPSRFFKNTDI